MKEYTLALDIGTTSVGWSVIDENYQIPEFKGKNLWGVRLFDSASTAESTRTKRGARRRYLRRRRRLELLQYLFQDEISSVDPSFFDVTVKSDEWLKNKPVIKDGMEYANFENKSLAEVLKSMGESTCKYKNIYFLQHDIITKNEKIDLRLLYLAIYSNVKYRGHFLNDFNFMDYKPTQNIEVDLLNYLELEELDTLPEVIEILKSKYNISTKKSDIKKYVKDKDLQEKLFLLVGSKVKLSNIFGNSNYDKPVCLKDDSPLDDLEVSDEDLDILEKGYNIYLDLLIGSVLSGKENICTAHVESYKDFNKDLKDFKYVVKRYKKSEYKKFFKKNGILDNYMYGKNHKAEDCNLTKEVAYKQITKIINDIKVDDEKLQNLKTKAADTELFLKQRSSINASTPHQLKAKDVYEMLNNQKEYYDFIDDEFIDNVLKLITYRIPYYVGPLLKNPTKDTFGWLKRETNEKITPWNIDDIIDKDSTAQEFIERMINRCTELYNVDQDIIDNKVMPKESLTYQLFTVYNELNGIRIKVDGLKPRCLTLEEREKIVENGFKKSKELKIKKAITCLGYNSETELIGTQKEDAFASSLSTYNFFARFVDNPLDYIDEIDEVVKVLNVFNDKEIIDRQLKKIDAFSDHVEKIKKLKVSGWGRLSRYLLIDIKDEDKSILDYLVEGSSKEVINFRKLITSDDYTFKKQIESLNKSNKKLDDDFSKNYCDVEKLAGSPALKRGVWETLKIANELITTHNLNIKYIAIEFAGGDEAKKRTDSFEKKFKGITKNSKVHSQLLEELENEGIIDYKNNRVRLYLLQQGKCLYSGESLDITKLEQYEVDHIRPRSLTKDDSIDNLALVVGNSNQRKNDGETVLEFIPANKKRDIIAFWSMLLNVGAISQVKYNRLMKEKNSEQELERFMQRTLVETRQIGKHVKELLNNYYGDEIKIYNVSSDFTSKFRKTLDIPKVRNLSVKHHCEDAYMLAVATAHTLKTFGEDFFELGKENTKLWYVSKESLLSSKNKSSIIIGNLVKENIEIGTDIIQNAVQYYKNELNKDFLITQKVSYATTNRLWEETNYSPTDTKKAEKYQDILKNKRVARNEYGNAYMLLVEYDEFDKKNKSYKRTRELITVSNLIDKHKNHDTYVKIADFILDNKKNISIIKRVDIGSIVEDKYRYTIKNVSEKSNFNEFRMSDDIYKSFANIANNEEVLSKPEVEECFDKIVEYIEINFGDIYGKNTYLIKEKFESKILKDEIAKAIEDFEKTLIDSYTNNSIYDKLKIDFVLDDAQVKLLEYKNGTSIEELIREIATVYSSGDIEVKSKAITLLNDAYIKALDSAYKKAYKKAVNELINAISIGAGRSESFGIGRMVSKISINDVSLIHQSPTGIIEQKTEVLSKIKRDKKLRKG